MQVITHGTFQVICVRGINHAGDVLFHMYWVYLLTIGWLLKQVYKQPSSNINFLHLCQLFILTTLRYIFQIFTNMFIDNKGGVSTSVIFMLNTLFVNIGMNLFLETSKKLLCTFIITSLTIFHLLMS